MWYSNPKHWPRLAAEKRVMLRHFPRASLIKANDGRLMWSFTLLSLTGHSYEVVLIYPDTFPSVSIEAYITNPQIDRHSPHLYPDGHLCLGHTSNLYTSAITTAVWAAAWASAYEIWREKNQWPEFKEVA